MKIVQTLCLILPTPCMQAVVVAEWLITLRPLDPTPSTLNALSSVFFAVFRIFPRRFKSWGLQISEQK